MIQRGFRGRPQFLLNASVVDDDGGLDLNACPLSTSAGIGWLNGSRGVQFVNWDL